MTALRQISEQLLAGPLAADAQPMAPRFLAEPIRARELAAKGELALACELVELASQAAPDDPTIHVERADIYTRRAAAERSLMARGVFGDAAARSRRKS